MMQRLNQSDHLYSTIIWWKSNFASLFVHVLSDFLIISRNILSRAMVNFSPSVGWCHPICMLHTDLFHDPEQHLISRLYLRNDLLALYILVWETDIYFHFDIWTTEHTSGILAGRDARSVLADSIGRHHIQTKIPRAAEFLQQSYIKTWETFHFQKLGLNKHGYSVNSKEGEVFIFPLDPWNLSATPPQHV